MGPHPLPLLPGSPQICFSQLIRARGLIWITAFCLGRDAQALPSSTLPPHLLRDLTGQIPGASGQCSYALSLCDGEVFPSRASLLLLTGALLFGRSHLTPCSFSVKGLGPEHGGPLHPGATWAETQPQFLQVTSRPCHDLTVPQAVVHLFLHLANIESLLSATNALLCPLGACRVGPVA